MEFMDLMLPADISLDNFNSITVTKVSCQLFYETFSTDPLCVELKSSKLGWVWRSNTYSYLVFQIYSPSHSNTTTTPTFSFKLINIITPMNTYYSWYPWYNIHNINRKSFFRITFLVQNNMFTYSINSNSRKWLHTHFSLIIYWVSVCPLLIQITYIWC